jgi:hypothetical protein
LKLMTGIYYYKLVSPYADDVTKNCKLTVNEIDGNFFNLKSADISAATYARDEDSKGTLVLVKNNGDKIIVPIDTTIDKNITYDFKANVECGDKSGATLTISYKDDSGENSMSIENILTADNLIDIIGSDILTKVITDNTLKGLGTMNSPLGIAGVEKTGMLAPAIKLVDLTDGSKLPYEAKEGTRYITKEVVNDYGYLYNGYGVEKITQLLDNEYESKQIYKEVPKRENYWRVPSKADWDKLLNSLEPCDAQNHHSAQCHVELGKVAGKFLKSECGWVGQEECTCDGVKPYGGCSYGNSSSQDNEEDDYIFDNTDVTPSESDENNSTIGIDKYGMTILPTGVASYKNGAKYEGIRETSFFWTTTPIQLGQDVYVKAFDYDKGGVWQVAECPFPYYSVRLVKDYDGSNYRDAEYIDGILYKTVLFPESGQIWLASNFADKNGFITINDLVGDEKPELLIPNGGHIVENRVEIFINEYNGRYWEKRVINEGDTIVVKNSCEIETSGTTKEFCWTDEFGNEHCMSIEIPPSRQNSVEYRILTDGDNSCNKILVNTNYLVVERILSILAPLVDKERFEREEADIILQEQIDEISAKTDVHLSTLWQALSAETSARTEVDEELWTTLNSEIETRESAVSEIWETIEWLSQDASTIYGAVQAEASARTEADLALSAAIETERDERILADEALEEKIEEETARAIERENEVEQEVFEETERAKSVENEISGLTVDTSVDYSANASSLSQDGYNLILKSKDGNPEHFIKIKLISDFGEI